MLTIKRVPTVVSNYQEDAAPEAPAGCGRNCLSDCCLPVSKLPLFSFAESPPTKCTQSDSFFLQTLLLGQWEERMSRGLFRYDVTTCETKVIPGEHGFVAQLNEGRHLKKRPTEFRIDRVLQPFDPAKFNFTKVGQEEVLLRFEAASAERGKGAGFLESAPVDASVPPNIVAINVSPIEYGHVLLIPRVLERLSQRIDHESLLLALRFAAEAGSPYFRLGYNSLGAFATINHLHFQAYCLAKPFPMEMAPTRGIPVRKGLPEGLKVSELLNYPVRVLVFEGESTLKELSDLVANACIWLQENNVPFNILISDSGTRIFLIPQCYAEKQALGEVSQEILDTQVNPAAWEIGGHIVLKRRRDYEEASEASAWRLLAEVSLSEERFQEVKDYVFGAMGLVESSEGEEEEKKGEAPIDANFQPPPPPPVAAHLPEGCLVLQ